MSSKGRAAEGYVADPNGFFETPPQVTRAGMTFWGIQPGQRILQPGCGTGAIAKVLRREYGKDVTIVGVEIDKARAKKAAKAKVRREWTMPEEGEETLPVYDEVVHMDFFEYQGLAAGKFDWAIENPSFAIWLKVAERCFWLADRTSLLIPWNSASSKGRADWWSQHPAYLRVLSKRPSFAISVKCVYSNGKRAAKAGANLCTFQELIPLSQKPKKECPVCGEPTETTRSDSNEYCWATWSTDVTHNRWDPLETPPLNEDDQ